MRRRGRSVLLRRAFLALLAGLAGHAGAQLLPGLGQTDGLLDPDKAFRISARALDRRSVEVEFRIADGYYLYRDRFSFATAAGEPLADVEIPRGTLKEDPFFGRTQTFRRGVRIRVPVSAQDAAKGSIDLKVTSQGCADVGVCYLPLEQTVRIELPGRAAAPLRHPR